ncbi:hypothetical protein F5Y07DRAFT_382617 [Xylaria sp. FL0933]|nr:hypothetical protein F5Y07DRAFT_382617 [Xylaria sp. FL0933]
MTESPSQASSSATNSPTIDVSLGNDSWVRNLTWLTAMTGSIEQVSSSESNELTLNVSLGNDRLRNLNWLTAMAAKQGPPTSDEPAPQISLENEAQSVLKPILRFSSSRPSARHPPSLQLSRTKVVDVDMGAHKGIKISPSEPTYDLGLGQFGPSRVDDSPVDELAPWWASYQVKIRREFLNGGRVDGFEDIDLQSEAAYEEEVSCEEEKPCEDIEDLGKANMSDEGYETGPTSVISDGQEFLDGLDNLEAARPKPSKRRQMTIPGNRENIWENPHVLASPLASYSGWIDEIANLEASLSLPPGTRYYKVDDQAEADESSSDGCFPHSNSEYWCSLHH